MEQRTSNKNFIITPEGDTINLDNVAKISIGVDTGVDDHKLYLFLGLSGTDLPATSGSHAYVEYTYSDPAAALAAKQKIDNALIGLGKVTSIT